MRNRITPRNRSLYGFVGKLYVLALSHWRVSGVDGRNRLELHFLESALPENSDWISCSGCENSRSSGEKPNFDPKPQKTRNDSSYQFFCLVLRIALSLAALAGDDNGQAIFPAQLVAHVPYAVIAPFVGIVFMVVY